MATIANLIIKLQADASGIKATLGDTTKGLTNVERGAGRTGSALGRIVSTAAGVVAAFGAIRVASAAWSFISESVVGVNNTLEQSQIQFENLTGSSTKAAKVVQDLFAFAAETPFETAPLIEATRALLTFGVEAEGVQESLRLVGDAAAGTSQPVQDVAFWFGRAKSAIEAGRPFGEAAQRLQEMGIVSASGRAKLEELQKSGASSREIFAALSQEFGRFTGQMVKQAETMPGLTSTIKDNFQLVLADGLKPFFDGMKAGLKVIADFVQTDRFEAWGAALKTVLTDNARALFEFGTGGIQTLIDGFGFVTTAIAPAVKGFELLANVVRNLRTPFSELKWEDLTATPLTDSLHAAAKAAANLSVEWSSNLAPAIVNGAASAVGATDEVTAALKDGAKAAKEVGDAGESGYGRAATAAEKAAERIKKANRDAAAASGGGGGGTSFGGLASALQGAGANSLSAEIFARSAFAFGETTVPFNVTMTGSPTLPASDYMKSYLPGLVSSFAGDVARNPLTFHADGIDAIKQKIESVLELTRSSLLLGSGLQTAFLTPFANVGLGSTPASVIAMGGRTPGAKAQEAEIAAWRAAPAMLATLQQQLRTAEASLARYDRTNRLLEENVTAIREVGVATKRITESFNSGAFKGFILDAAEEAARLVSGQKRSVVA